MAKSWSYSEGDYGHRVRVFTRSGRKCIYIEHWDAALGKRVPFSLGHADREKARNQCRDLSDALRLGVTLPAAAEVSSALEPVAPTAKPVLEVRHEPQPVAATAARALAWDLLFALYHEEEGQYKKGAQPREDLRRQKVWRAFFALEKIEEPGHLDQSAIKKFTRLRIKGRLHVDGVKLTLEDPERPGEDVVTATTVHADVVYLVTVLNWANQKRTAGKRLLAEVPIRLPVLKTPEPRRPIATYEDVRDLRRVANQVDPRGYFGCYIRLHDALGWRVTAVCSIKASEVCLQPHDGMPYGYVRKNPAVDKEAVGQRVPLSRLAQATFKRLLRLRGAAAGDDKFLFAGPKDVSRPWLRWYVRDLTNRAERLAEIAHMGGSHAFRRKWVSERKDHPIPDIMAAGGWTDERSLRAYLHDDTDTTFQVVSRPTRRIRRRAA